MNRLIRILNKILAISDQVYIKMTIIHDQVKLFKEHKNILIYHINRFLKTMSSSKKASEKNTIFILELKKKRIKKKKEKLGKRNQKVTSLVVCDHSDLQF